MNEFEKALKNYVKQYGGWFNAHAHIDRSHTMKRKYYEHADMNPWQISNYPLVIKQHVTGDLHEGKAYTKEDLILRISGTLEEMINMGYKRIDSFIDTTADISELRALKVALELKEKYAGKIDFRVGAYPIFGFKDDKPERWETFEEGAKLADFIGTLPERDARQRHIGFKEHFRRVLELANKLDYKEVHMHVDQTNNPNEDGTETLIEAVRWLRPDRTGYWEKKDPTVWAVHALSVSSYNEERFRRLIEGFKETNIGIIVCPSATLANKQDRGIYVPMHNSITRVLDFVAESIPVRIGSDNIDDVYMPTGSADMYLEIRDAANALRFPSSPKTLAKIATGTRLNEIDKKHARDALNGIK